MSDNIESASPKKPQATRAGGLNQSQAQSQQQQQQILLPHRQGHVTLPHGQVHLYPTSDNASTTSTTTAPTATAAAAGAGQRLLTARERDALIEDLQLEAQTRVRKLRSHYELAARALRAKILMRINRVPRRYWDMTLRELQTRPAAAATGAATTSEGVRVTKSASTGSKTASSNTSAGSGGGGGGVVTGKTTAATAAAAIRRTGRAAAGARHGTALSAEAGRRGLTRSLRSRGS